VPADFQSTPEGPSAPATAVPPTSDTGYFWFFDPSNIELVVKVLHSERRVLGVRWRVDGC
jgi:hypothetical protein